VAGVWGRARLGLVAFALPVLPLLLAGCGGKAAPAATGHPTTTRPVSAGPALNGLGATTAEWDAHHARATTSSPGGPSYGPQIPFAAGEVEQFTAVKITDGRIAGWHMAFRDGTSIANVEHQVYAQLPADSRQTASRRATFTGSTDICEMVAFESATLTKVLGAADGTVGVTLFQVGITGKGSPSIEVVDRAIVTVPAPAVTAAC
jgi:hypothetical protein